MSAASSASSASAIIGNSAAAGWARIVNGGFGTPMSAYGFTSIIAASGRDSGTGTANRRARIASDERSRVKVTLGSLLFGPPPPQERIRRQVQGRGQGDDRWPR